MSYLQIGTGYKQPDWCTALIKCGSEVGVECTEFTDSGAGVTVYHLYNVSGCDYISKSNLVIDIRDIGTKTWIPWATYTMGGYEGFVYNFITIIGGTNLEYKVTYKGLTKYYTVRSPCVPNWQCRQPMDGYETDLNSCGEADRYNESCDIVIVCREGCAIDGSYDYFTGNLVEGECEVIKNSELCGYVPSDDSAIDKYLIIGGLGVVGLALLLLSKRSRME